MDKFQKALSESVDRKDKENYKNLKELVDRATQKKKIQKHFNEAELPWDFADKYVLRVACPSCENKLIEECGFCPHCGQAIDWSNEE